MDYPAYLRSTHWKKMRRRILDRAGGRCEKKGCSRAARQVHHKTYARLGAEKPTDLEAVCIPCHASEHPDKIKKSRKDRGTFLLRFPCESCRSEYIDVHAGQKIVWYWCTTCGHHWKRKRRGLSGNGRKKARKKKKRNQAPPGQCRCECGNLVSKKDTAAGIGKCGACQKGKKKRRSPSLEEMDRERRERERDRVMALKEE